MPASLTPMMRQYMELKEKYTDSLLFFRLGDFYEMFFEDAITAARELEIVLTGRDCGLEERAPMCGVPHHSADNYISRLIEKGYKVAVCEQMSDPSEGKGLVERDVVRVYTPGTIIEESMLNERVSSYIASLFLCSESIGIAYCDVSTGEFSVSEFAGETWMSNLNDDLERLQPREIIANDALFMQEMLIKRLQSSYYVQCYGNWAFETDFARNTLARHFKVNTLSGYGIEQMTLAISAAGALIAYLNETQKNSLEHINRIHKRTKNQFMGLDASTRRNLELTKPIHFDGSKKSTLVHLLDKTATSMGARMLREWLNQPLQLEGEINRRLDAVAELVSSPMICETMHASLNQIYDIERLCSRIAYGTINARDCESLKISLGNLPRLIEDVKELHADAFCLVSKQLDPMEDIFSILNASIIENPPVSVKEGGILRDGYNASVDEYRTASREGKTWLAQLEASERNATGIKNLKIGFNKVFGYYLEVTKSYQHLVPYTYQRKQTLTNAERYITPELKEMEESILGAEEKCIALEYKLFQELRELLARCIERLQDNSRLIAEMDVYLSLAKVAYANQYCRPQINTTGKISIIDGRHPVVERNLKDGFIANNTTMDNKDNRLLILTGPNMAGKSTYMRQVALITLMAHIGSFVPATSANICITDRIFTRVGASDNLAFGQSTFMVEMSEVSNILNNATSSSLLILDEIGRGTSTFDGLSIAWAVLEHIADTAKCGAKTLFATHYHELTELETKLSGVKNYRISVKEVGDDIIFLRKIMRGGADKSFGVQVARLAGLPSVVIERAKQILKQLEEADINQVSQPIELGEDISQMTLFGSATADDIIDSLKGIDVNSLTPVEALNLIYDLHMRAKMR